MIGKRAQRKAFLLFLSFGGYGWILWSLFAQSSGENLPLLCPIKRITGIPCPSCGSTRSLVKVLHGQLEDAFLINPIGLGLAIGLVLAPFLLVSEFKTAGNRPTLSDKIEAVFRKKLVYVPALIFIVLNWVWNIHKGL